MRASTPTSRAVLASPEQLVSTRSRVHPGCLVCGPANPMGLSQEFRLGPDGSVESTFTGGELFEGYTGRLHGGITAALLDGAMTNCLFARGVVAVTAELTVRYREPVAAGRCVTVRASWMRSHGRLHVLRAELKQEGRVKGQAVGKFMQNDE